MITAFIIALVALVVFALVAVPLLLPGLVDPLPDERDSVTQNLEEERDALFRAIRELEARQDMPEERRASLRVRYEAKAAKVLRALDERAAVLSGHQRSPRVAAGRRFPTTAVVVLALVVLTAAALPGALLPRVGDQATVTTTDVDAARQLKALQDAARKEPSTENLFALGDAYFTLQQTDDAEATYQKVLDTAQPVPAEAYKRMAFLYLQTDLDKASSYLQQAYAVEPDDPDTLFAIGEVSFARADLTAAKEAFEAYLDTPGNSSDEQAQQRIALIKDVDPLLAHVRDDPSAENLMAVADSFWGHGQEDLAVGAYFQVLSGPDPSNVRALSRTGQLLFQRGRPDDAIGLFERAAGLVGGLDGLDQDSLLMFGNAYFAQESYQPAIDAWTVYVANAGGDAQAGRVPDLIASARARLAGAADGPGTDTALAGQRVFEATCATCHGAAGQGGAAPRLVGNRRATDAANVNDLVRFGRGMMPGFMASLSEAEIDAVVTFVTTTLAAQEP